MLGYIERAVAKTEQVINVSMRHGKLLHVVINSETLGMGYFCGLIGRWARGNGYETSHR